MKEKEIEKALMEHLKKFMIELGKGFAWVGNQVKLVIDGEEFYLDLLFFNYNLNCFVTFELKIGEFKPEYAGKLNFYINAINEQIKGKEHHPTIGILLCKAPNETVVKYSLQQIGSPIGVADYLFGKTIPSELKMGLPTVEELEKEIEQGFEELMKPAEKKIDVLKNILKNLKETEVKEKKTPSFCQVIFEKTMQSLLSKMINRFESDLGTMFEENELTIYVNRQGFQSFSSSAIYIQNELKYACDELRIEFRSNGFKPVGKKAFNCWSGLNVELQKYKYHFAFIGNPQNVLIEKLYHEKLTDTEENELVEKWIELLLDDITFQVQRIISENNTTLSQTSN